MNQYYLVYKLPDEPEQTLTVEGENFSDGWRNAGNTQEDLDKILAHFPARKTKGGLKPGEAPPQITDKKRKVEKWFFLYWIGGNGHILKWQEPTRCDETGKHFFVVEEGHCQYNCGYMRDGAFDATKRSENYPYFKST